MPRALQELAMTYAERAPSRQITGAAAVVAIHAALILALVNGLAERPPISLPPDIELVPVKAEQPVVQTREVRPLVANANSTTVDVVEPVRDVVIEFDSDIIIAQPDEQTNPGSVETALTITQPSPLRSDPRLPMEPPDYPASAIRQNQEGTVQLLIYVLPNGSVGDVKIGRSSGCPLLDASAVRKARTAWRFLPATSGSGQSIAAWGTFDVKFQLN